MDGSEHRDCFVDSDGIICMPNGLHSEETVTHWAALPSLLAHNAHGVLGADAQPALQNAWDPPSLT
ncbi:hypothetical protein AB0L65_53090 [Nonomuraea sp. NPDC052116]|uniref:hypothetical protein n=1 Tax=Nonomuraea sp. NPDC052116 TaxID=3155665 RepID=UPI0034492FC7